MEALQIRKARQEELAAIVEFYNELIDYISEKPYSPKWKKDVYPEKLYLGDAISRGELYVAYLQNDVAGAMILNREANEGFRQANWPVKAEPEEVLMLHTLATSPKYMREGVGKALVREAIRVAQSENNRVIRLDVIKGNIPAEQLYQRMGFYYVQSLELFYDDCGWYPFDLYEYSVEDGRNKSIAKTEDA